MKKQVIALAIIATLTGCTSQAQKIAECEADGISRDACYMAVKNHDAAMTAAAEAAALHNAAQLAQSAKKASNVKHFNGFEIRKDKLGIVSFDGKPAAVIETTDKATVYQSGITKITWYKNGKVAVMENDVFSGWAR